MNQQGKQQEVVKSYKGFDKEMVCHPAGGERVQYQVGETYNLDGDIEACSRGFHACEDPLDVLGYYPPAGSRFAEVEQSGQISRKGDDSKVASSSIKISAEIGLPGLIKAAIEYRVKRAKPESSESSTGDYGAASSTGYQGAASSTGNRGAASSTGYQGKVMGAEGNALFLVERDEEFKIVAVWAGIAGQDGIKPGVWYTLRAGQPVEA